MLSYGPTHRYLARNAATSGGNVTNVPNSVGAGQMDVSLGTLAAPTSEKLVFTNTQQLKSNLAKSVFRFLTDGTGYTSLDVFRITTLQTMIQWTTRDGSGSGPDTGTQVYSDGANWSLASTVQGSIVYLQPVGAAANTLLVWRITSIATGSSPQVLNYKGTTALNSGAVAQAPDTTGPLSTFCIGSDAASFSRMEWYETVLFPSRLPAGGITALNNYAASYYAPYGITA